MRKIGRYHLIDWYILKYLAEDRDLADWLADELEIEVDGGESAGAFLSDTCQRMLDEQEVASLRTRLGRAEERLGRTQS